jgi:hypothetical protein
MRRPSTQHGRADDTDDALTHQPKYSRFTQQELPACRPLLTPLVATVVLFGLGLLFLPLGVVVFQASRSVVDQARLADPAPSDDFSPRGRETVAAG